MKKRRTGWAQESTSLSVSTQHAHFSIAFEILQNQSGVRRDPAWGRAAWGHATMCQGSPVTRGKAEFGDSLQGCKQQCLHPRGPERWGGWEQGTAIRGHRCTDLTDLIRSQSSGLGASYLYWTGFSFTYWRSKGKGEAGLPQPQSPEHSPTMQPETPTHPGTLWALSLDRFLLFQSYFTH